jgi:hypothetical protein
MVEGVVINFIAIPQLSPTFEDLIYIPKDHTPNLMAAWHKTVVDPGIEQRRRY